MNSLISTFKLLSDETRLRIVYLLSKEELCVCQITGILNISQPKASKALSKLRDLDWVTDDRRDKFVFYKLNEHMGLINHIMVYIENNQSIYEQMESDVSRLHLKKEFLTKCSTTQIKL